MPSLLFSERVKHGRLDLHPGVRYGFEDDAAAAYFKAAGWAVDDDGEPAVVIASGEIEIDPETTFADGPNRGKRVLGETD